jgi:hypothetical protein
MHVHIYVHTPLLVPILILLVSTPIPVPVPVPIPIPVPIYLYLHEKEIIKLLINFPGPFIRDYSSVQKMGALKLKTVATFSFTKFCFK